MSSLLSKIKTLLGAGARGRRRYERAATPPVAGPDEQPQAEVSEASADRRELPEVTEAPPSAARTTPSRTAVHERMDQRAAPAEPAPDLEDARVADLLQDDES